MPDERDLFIPATEIVHVRQYTDVVDDPVNPAFNRSWLVRVYAITWAIPDVRTTGWVAEDVDEGFDASYSGGTLVPNYSQLYARGGVQSQPLSPLGGYESDYDEWFEAHLHTETSLACVAVMNTWEDGKWSSYYDEWIWHLSPDLYGTYLHAEHGIPGTFHHKVMTLAMSGGGSFQQEVHTRSLFAKTTIPAPGLLDYSDVQLLSALCKIHEVKDDPPPPPPALPIKSLVSAAYKDEAVAVASLSANADANQKRQLSIHVTRAGFCAGTPWASYVLRSVDADSKIGLAWIEPQTLVVNYVIGGVKTYQTNKCMGRAGYWSAPAALTPAAQILNSGLGQGQAFRVRTS